MEIIIQVPDSTVQLSELNFSPPLSVFAPSWHLFLLPQRPKVTKKTLVYFFYFLHPGLFPNVKSKVYYGNNNPSP